MSRTFRARLSSYIILTICIGITPAIALLIALRGDSGPAWIVAVGIGALLFTYFWLSRFRLTITPQSLTYRSLFTGERVIELSEVEDSQIISQSGLYGVRSLLEVTARGVKTRINFKVFSLEAAQTVFHLVGPNQSLQPTAGRSDE
jgi:hypothetical protein